METYDIVAAVEGILFASGEPVAVKRLAQMLEIDDKAAEYALEKLSEHYNEGKRGIRLLRVEESAQLCSAPEYADVIRRVLEKRRVPQLSPTALEVLSIVAYFQPVTRAYIERVRGVDSAYTVGMLQSRGLIEQCGQLQVPGRPALFRTTNAFLRSFGLSRIEELPPLPDAEEDDAQAQLKSAIEAIQREQEEAARATSEGENFAGTLFSLEEPPDESQAELELQQVGTEEAQTVPEADEAEVQ